MSLPVFQRVSDAAADQIHRGAKDGALSKATQGGAGNGKQNRHETSLLLL